MILNGLLALVLSTGVPSCSQVAPASPAGNYITPGVFGDITYKTGAATSTQALKLDAYAPPGLPRSAAVIFQDRGSGKRTHVTQLFDVLARAGYAWFSVESNTFADATQALDYIRCPGRFNITNDLVLIGVGTAGSIVLRLASQGRFAGAVLFGISSANPGRSATAPDSLPQCPVLMFHGTADETFPASKAETLCKKLPHCRFYAIAGAIHDFENWRPDQWSWREDLTTWLRRDQRGLWKDIAYSRPDGRDLLMDAWIPEGGGPFPAVIIMHGGGWEAGDKVTYVPPVFEPLAKAGFAWFSIDYRLTPYVHVDSELDDLREAIRYVRRHAARFHVEPERIAILGESASGHLVTQVGSQPCPGCEVQAIVSFYSVYDFTQWPQGSEDQRQTVRQIFGDPKPEILERGSPINCARADMPPVLLIQGSKDLLAKGTEAYAAKLKQVGARYELVRLPGAPHGMSNWEGHPEWMFYKQKLVDWLRSAFDGS